MPAVNTVGIVYNASIAQAQELAQRIVQQVGEVRRTWLCPAIEADALGKLVAGTDLVITVGGDGTILRVAPVAAPHGVPLLGVNLGRVGFMTELSAGEALTRLGRYLEGDGQWVEERAMLQVEGGPQSSRQARGEGSAPVYALNEVVVGRGAAPRLVRIKTSIDDVYLTTYKADALIVATATGSTAYALSAGGPVLHPQATDILLKAVAPHVSFASALVLPGTAVVDLTVHTDHLAMLSVDGYVDWSLSDGDTVQVRKSPYPACFLRIRPPSHFFMTLQQRLGLDNASGTRPSGPALS